MSESHSSNENSFVYDPVNKGESRHIQLTKSGSAWLVIDHIPEELANYAADNYDELFRLHPEDMGKVVMGEKEVKSSRWHKCYMHTPPREGGEKSYMFCGLRNTDINDPLPEKFAPFLEFMNQGKEFGYNQVVANWYKNGTHYIARHADYTKTMIEGFTIASISLNDPSNMGEDAKCRVLTFKAKLVDGVVPDDICFHSVSIVQRHGTIVTMCGDTQELFTHGVPKITQDGVKFPSRISLSFRQFKV